SADAGGIDFAYASHVCVRDGSGKWRESVLAGISSRLDVVPRLDGGVVVARMDSNKHLELVAVPAGATLSTVPSRLRVDVEPSSIDRSLVSIDESSAGRVVVWRKIGDALEALTVATDGGALRIVARAPAIKIDDAVYGTFGDHALVVGVDKGKDGKPRVGVAKVTRDAGAHWEVIEW